MQEDKDRSILEYYFIEYISAFYEFSRYQIYSRLRLTCDGTRAETRFLLSAKRTSPFKPAGASVQSTTRSRGVRISGSNVGYIMFRGSVKSTGYTLHSPVSPSLPLPCVTVCHHVSAGLYYCVVRIISERLISFVSVLICNCNLYQVRLLACQRLICTKRELG